MSYLKFRENCLKGIKRDIKSRRERKKISPEKFYILVERYFNDLPLNKNFKFNYNQNDLDDLLFILRYEFNLWLEISEKEIEIYNNFPEKFILINNIDKTNHYHTPKSFSKGTIMYFLSNSGGYSSCNWLNGIPLWHNKDDVYEQGLRPSVQINYDFIKRYDEC